MYPPIYFWLSFGSVNILYLLFGIKKVSLRLVYIQALTKSLRVLPKQGEFPIWVLCSSLCFELNINSKACFAYSVRMYIHECAKEQKLEGFDTRNPCSICLISQFISVRRRHYFDNGRNSCLNNASFQAVAVIKELTICHENINTQK